MARERRGRLPDDGPRRCRCASRSTSPSTSSSSSSCTPSNRPPTPRSPAHAHHPAPHRRDRSARRSSTDSPSPSARSTPASATPSATRCAARCSRSIPGAAATQVRFDAALHEFTTIEGVKEDVTDILLNLKDMILQVHCDEPVVIRLDKRGPGDALASDFQIELGRRDPERRPPHRDTERAGPPGPRRDRRARQGLRERGAQQAPRRDRRDPARLGVLARAAGHVHGRARPRRAVDGLRPAGPGDRDRRVHLAARGPRLGGRRRCAASSTSSPRSTRSPPASSSATSAPRRARARELDYRIEELGLTERARNCLKRGGINTVAELINCTASDLLSITNFGQTSLKDVTDRLDERGLALRSED